MKRIFKIRYGLERGGLWSGRESEFLCYLLKPSQNSDMVYGFSSCISATSFPSPRYVKGFMSNNGLILMQFTNTYGLAPICIYFPSLTEDGLWSNFDIKNGIFPLFTESRRADGNAKLIMSEIPHTEKKEGFINKIVTEFLKLSDVKVNNELMTSNFNNYLNENFFVEK